MRLKTYIDVSEDASLLVEVAFLIDNNLNEDVSSILDKINSTMKSMGLHSKQGKGIIQYTAQYGKAISQILYYALKANKGDAEAKAKIKEITSKELTKEQFIDFLLKLDTLSLHAVTMPIHIIDAITGWHVAANLDKMQDPIFDRIQKAVEFLENAMEKATGQIKRQLQNVIAGIKRLVDKN